MLRKIKRIDRVGISKPIQWIWLQRWPLIIIITLVIAAPTFYGIHWYLAPDRVKNKSGDEFLQEKQIAQVKKDVLQITSQMLVGVTVLSGAYFTWQRLEVSREDQITDRFTRAIDQLGSEHLEIRLGGIYALERLAKDSLKDQETVMEVLTAFVRENSSRHNIRSNLNLVNTEEALSNPFSQADQNNDLMPPKTDIQAILTVIGRRKWAVVGSMDLSGANLYRANLQGASLSRANLQRANLQEAILEETNLQGANLREANLERANLQEAKLQKANLEKANLREANLERANLQEAKLQNARLLEVLLSKADLQLADLQLADLQEARLFRANLQEAKLAGANLQGAILEESNLQGTGLFKANLQGTNLIGAKGITDDQLTKARYSEQVIRFEEDRKI